MEHNRTKIHLNKVVEFLHNERSSTAAQFLQFIVSEYLAGNEALLKEYTIAVYGLGEESSFDPQTNSLVRVSAGRLRKKLDEFYEGPGRNETIRISIPLGGYVPKIDSLNGFAENPVEYSGKQAPLILIIERCLYLGQSNIHEAFANELVEQLVVALKDSQDIAVLPMQSRVPKDGAQLPASKGYVLESSLFNDETNTRLYLKLISQSTHFCFWAESFEFELKAESLSEIHQPIVAAVQETISTLRDELQARPLPQAMTNA